MSQISYRERMFFIYMPCMYVHLMKEFTSFLVWFGATPSRVTSGSVIRNSWSSQGTIWDVEKLNPSATYKENTLPYPLYNHWPKFRCLVCLFFLFLVLGHTQQSWWARANPMWCQGLILAWLHARQTNTTPAVLCPSPSDLGFSASRDLVLSQFIFEKNYHR